MSRAIEAAMIAAIGSADVRWLMLARVEFDGGTIAFSSGVGDVDFDGVTYLGFGHLGSVSELKENNDLDPQSYTLELSGVNPALLAAILNEKYMNRRALCHVAALDESNQFIGQPLLYFDGLVDGVSCSYGSTASITVVVKDRLADWNRPRIERYTDQDQQARHPGDRGFEFVPSLANKEIIWPARSWYENNR